jgi:hypothetical protein
MKTFEDILLKDTGLKVGYYKYYDPEDQLSFPYRKYHYDKTRSGRTKWLNNIICFWGNNTTYKIENDNLKIYDPSLKTWSNQKVNFLSKDTMVLLSVNDTIPEIYIRKTYHIENEPLFDQIIFYCPDSYFAESRSFSIERNGRFICSGCFTGRMDDIFVGKIESGVFERPELLFKKADLPRILDEKYNLNELSADSGYDMLELNPQNHYPYVSFVSENKLYTIESFLGDVFFENKEFTRACLQGLFFPEQVRFIPETLNKQKKLFSEFDSYRSLAIEKQDSIIVLYYIERFYLSILLSQAKVTEEKFQPVYILKESLSAKEKIETDGRYFSYMKNDEKVTLDIGFNFIGENNFDKLFGRESYGEWLRSNGMEFTMP